jgi:thermolabile hemolysin
MLARMASATQKRFRSSAFALTLVLLFVRTVAAAPFSSLFVFGDSLSDVGNISQTTLGTTPGQYYSNGRFSNGPVYAESLATGLGLPSITRSAAGGNDFAYGGAQTTGTGGLEGFFIRDIDEQVTQFLSSRTANATSLFLIFAGANDLIGGQTNMAIPVNSLANSINRLVTAGARQFLVFNLPPLGSTPRYNGNPATRDQYNARTQQFNTALATMLGGVQAGNPALTVYQLDVFGMFNRALADPAAFGLLNVTSSAAPGLQPGDSSYNTNQIVPNPNQYAFWDDLHPTISVHAILAGRARSVPPARRFQSRQHRGWSRLHRLAQRCRHDLYPVRLRDLAHAFWANRK